MTFLVVAMFAAIGCSANASSDTWEPPSSPDPRDILGEARDDREHGRYELALEKHVWFHENALTFRPSLAGVRLSYALDDWLQLAARYPPALESPERGAQREGKDSARG